ncbi:MAG: alpha/beta hydrolase [Pseudomonadota bacterium]
MRFLKWTFIGVGSPFLLALLGVTISVMSALDWDRAHTNETAALPFYETGASDGLYQLRANGLIFRARIHGAANDGPGIILLHGHPETSIMWEPLARAAAGAGYRVIAFDQRGYSPGARPKGVAPYKADNQIADVIAVAGAMGFERFHLVGHDWGAVIAWATAVFHPERLESLTAMSIPHPATLTASVVNEPPLYIQLFSLPWLPEATLLFNDLAGYKNFYSEQSDEEIAEYLRVFSEPGASTAALNWYRGIQNSLSLIAERNADISAPTLFIYGDQELWVTPDFLAQQRTLMSGAYSELELNAGHWLIQPHTETVIDAVLSHISAYPPGESLASEER